VDIDKDAGAKSYRPEMPYDMHSTKFAIDAMLAAFKGREPINLGLCLSHGCFVKYDVGTHTNYDQHHRVHGRGKNSGRDCQIRNVTAHEASMIFDNPKVAEVLARVNNFAYHAKKDMNLSELKRPWAKNTSANMMLVESRKTRERERQRNHITE